MILTHGISTSIYDDRHTIFHSPKADKISIKVYGCENCSGCKHKSKCLYKYNK